MLAHWLLFLWMILMSQCICHTKYSFRGWGFVYRYKEAPITWTLFTLSNLRCASLNQIALSALGTLVPILVFLAALSSQSATECCICNLSSAICQRSSCYYLHDQRAWARRACQEMQILFFDPATDFFCSGRQAEWLPSTLRNNCHNCHLVTMTMTIVWHRTSVPLLTSSEPQLFSSPGSLWRAESNQKSAYKIS